MVQFGALFSVFLASCGKHLNSNSSFWRAVSSVELHLLVTVLMTLTYYSNI